MRPTTRVSIATRAFGTIELPGRYQSLRRKQSAGSSHQFYKATALHGENASDQRNQDGVVCEVALLHKLDPIENPKPPSDAEPLLKTSLFLGICLVRYTSLLILCTSEPCIRGHRSTKCNHANERLMVPVRKPGRPLSSCPHSGGNCGCGSVTAAIPRKQACGCGNGTPVQAVSQVAGPEVSSPTKPNFKIQKSSRPPPNRKQSFDLANFTRMSIEQVNLISGTSTMTSRGYQVGIPQQIYNFPPQYTEIEHQHTTTPLLQALYPTLITSKGINDRGNSPRTRTLDQVIESASKSDIAADVGGIEDFQNKITFDSPSKIMSSTNGNSQKVLTGGSCCAPKQNGRSKSASGSPNYKVPGPKLGGSCCAPKQEEIFKQEPMINEINTRNSDQSLQQNGIDFEAAMWPQFRPTVFTYPPTYGSWQNPLHPSAWRQSRNNEYAQLPQTGPLPLGVPSISETLDTVHTCGCGDSCECIGCAAHPYNNATQEYVRSAWESMSLVNEPDIYNTSQQGHHISNGSHITAQQHAQTREMVSSPTTQSPSSMTSAMGEDQNQNLSEQDFLFVRYSLQDGGGGQEGCLGDTQSCPCGDDCECLGCTIHRQPMPCEGSDETCLCGDECECIGCEIHKVGLGKLPG